MTGQVLCLPRGYTLRFISDLPMNRIFFWIRLLGRQHRMFISKALEKFWIVKILIFMVVRIKFSAPGMILEINYRTPRIPLKKKKRCELCRQPAWILLPFGNCKMILMSTIYIPTTFMLC